MLVRLSAADQYRVISIPPLTRRASSRLGWKVSARDHGSSLSRELCREHVDLFDLGRRSEQLAGPLGERRGDGAGEVCLPAGLVGEDVDDRERRDIRS